MTELLYPLYPLACDCNRNGTAHVSNVSFGDCVRDENELSLHPGKVTLLSVGTCTELLHNDSLTLVGIVSLKGLNRFKEYFYDLLINTGNVVLISKEKVTFHLKRKHFIKYTTCEKTLFSIMLNISSIFVRDFP